MYIIHNTKNNFNSRQPAVFRNQNHTQKEKPRTKPHKHIVKKQTKSKTGKRARAEKKTESLSGLIRL
jgi:hypothetical protein